MSETPQPYDVPKFPDTWGDVKPVPIEAIRARVNKALAQIEQPRPAKRGYTIERVGNDIKLSCPCGKSLTQSVVFFNAFVRNIQRFFDEHSYCLSEE